MERRTFLRAGSLGIAALVAGCNSSGSSSSGDNNSTDASGSNSTSTAIGDTPSDASAEEPATTQSGPAQFSDVALQGPQNVTVGEDFTLPISVANSGGQNGTFSGTLTVAEGSASFNRSITIEGVQPGSTANTTVGPINISSTDNYTLAIKGTNTTHKIEVNPVKKQPGKSITVNNLKLSVKGIRLTPALFYSVDVGYAKNDGTGTGLLSAGSGKILCIIHVSLENVGTNQTTFTIPSDSGGMFSGSSTDSTMLTLPKGTFYTSLPNGGDLSRIQGVRGKPLTTVQLGAGQSQNGWLVAQLPRSAASKTVRVGYQSDTKDTPPEIVWPFPPKRGPSRSLPKFSLDSFKVPRKVQLGRDNTYTIRVTNTGNGAGTYRSITQFKAPDDRNWNSYNKQKAKIAPGKTKSFKQPIVYSSNPQLGEAQFRLRPFGKTTPITFDTAKLKFGQTYTAPNGQNITVSDVQQADSYQTAGNEPTTPQQSQHFVLTRIGVKFVEQDTSGVSVNNFNLVSGGSTFEPTYVYADRFTTPVQADALSGSLSGPKGSSQSGYIVYSVPKNVTPSNTKIAWSAETPWARWQQG